MISTLLKDRRDRKKTKYELAQTRKLLLVELEGVLNDLWDSIELGFSPTLKCNSYRSLEKGIADLPLPELRAVDAAYKKICEWNSVCAGKQIIETSDEHPRDRVAYHVRKAIQELKIGLEIDD